MASCKDCVHVDVCEDITRHKLSPSRAEKILPILREHGKTCELFKDRSRFVELPDYKYSAEERFRGAVQELIDIAKASETPSKILQATSESLAHFACGLSKLEETKQTLKERENNAE